MSTATSSASVFPLTIPPLHASELLLRALAADGIALAGRGVHFLVSFVVVYHTYLDQSGSYTLLGLPCYLRR